MDGLSDEGPAAVRRALVACSERLRHSGFGVSWNGTIPDVPGGLVLSEKVNLTLEVEGILQKPEA